MSRAFALLMQAAAVTGMKLCNIYPVSTPHMVPPAMLAAATMMTKADMATGQSTCWMLALTKLSEAGADAITDVLLQAQKQGNWLRGLEGTVLIESKDNLQILAAGPEDRLESFAEWCRESLAGAAVAVSIVDTNKAEYCSLLPLTKSFALTGSGAGFEIWKERMSPYFKDVEMTGWSEEAQF